MISYVLRSVMISFVVVCYVMLCSLLCSSVVCFWHDYVMLYGMVCDVMVSPCV